MIIEHTPVMLQEVVQLIDADRDELVIDATVGMGGHAEALLDHNEAVRLIGIDRDQQALRRASQRLERFASRARLIHGEFRDLRRLLAQQSVVRVDAVLADLGVSSLQLDRAERGFSFRFDGPLDMRMDQSRGLTAADLLARVSETELQRILKEYGEERQVRRIAAAIVAARELSPIESTSQLRDVVHRALGRTRTGRGRNRAAGIDSATRTFQALRIEVNQELAGIGQLVEQSIEMLNTGGRLVVISYHSLEDRIVKNALRDAANGQADAVTGRRPAETRLIELMTKKPMRPEAEEVRLNPRARSARLRAARRR